MAETTAFLIQDAADHRYLSLTPTFAVPGDSIGGDTAHPGGSGSMARADHTHGRTDDWGDVDADVGFGQHQETLIGGGFLNTTFRGGTSTDLAREDHVHTWKDTAASTSILSSTGASTATTTILADRTIQAATKKFSNSNLFDVLGNAQGKEGAIKIIHEDTSGDDVAVLACASVGWAANGTGNIRATLVTHTDESGVLDHLFLWDVSPTAAGNWVGSGLIMFYEELGTGAILDVTGFQDSGVDLNLSNLNNETNISIAVMR